MPEALTKEIEALEIQVVDWKSHHDNQLKINDDLKVQITKANADLFKQKQEHIDSIGKGAIPSSNDHLERNEKL